MNKAALVFVLLLPLGVRAETPDFSFANNKVDLPPKSLSELGKKTSSSPLPILRESRDWFRQQGAPPRSEPSKPRERLASNMPIRVPKAQIDERAIKVPAANFDYKLRLKIPDLEATNEKPMPGAR